MESSDLNPDREQEPVKSEQDSSEQGGMMANLLKHIRARRYQQSVSLDPLTHAEAGEQQGLSDTSTPGIPQESKYNESEETDIAASINEIGQEVRRLGRELFKVNRAAEGNQELFTEAITEVRHLTSLIARIPEQGDEALRDAKFEAKVEMCHELLRMADALEASISAADGLIERIESQTPQEGEGLAFLFDSGKQMHGLLTDSAAAMRQWRDGQQLLAARLEAILQSAGVRRIESINNVFNPSLHRAVYTQQDDTLPSGTIVGEELKGYTLEGRVLRYAEVIVVKNE